MTAILWQTGVSSSPHVRSTRHVTWVTFELAVSKKGPNFGFLDMDKFYPAKWTDDSDSRNDGSSRDATVADGGLRDDGLSGGSSALRAEDPRRSTTATPNAEAINHESPVRRRYRVARTGGRLKGVSPEPSRNRAGGRRGAQVRTGEPDAGLWFHLTERDRLLLAVLGEHKVLTTSQVAEVVGFSSLRRAQDRLRRLRGLGVVFAFRESYLNGGTSEARNTLGYLGRRLIAARRAVEPPRPAAYQQTLERLAAWPKLNHQLGANDFFCRLAGDAYRSDGAAGLTQWWSETRCGKFFWTDSPDKALTPDGYGCWEERGRVVRFFLEHDTGTEPLRQVVGKISRYSGFPTDRFGVLLFSVHSAERERSLRVALAKDLGGYGPGFVVATTVRGDDGPAGPVWALWTARGGEGVARRLRLAELPERGPRIEHHAPFVGEPFSRASLDTDDPRVTKLLSWSQR